jgi:hypothetical protein
METPTTFKPKQHSFTNTLITISLQLLLWSSLFPLSVQISFFGLHKVDKSLFLTDVICIAAVSFSAWRSDYSLHILTQYIGRNIRSFHSSTHFGRTAQRERLQQMGQSICSNLQGPRSLLFMHSSAVMDYDSRTGHNLFSGKTADVSVSQL